MFYLYTKWGQKCKYTLYLYHIDIIKHEGVPDMYKVYTPKGTLMTKTNGYGMNILTTPEFQL